MLSRRNRKNYVTQAQEEIKNSEKYLEKFNSYKNDFIS